MAIVTEKSKRYKRKFAENEDPIFNGDKLYGVIRDGTLLDIRKHDDLFVYVKDAYGNLQKTVCIATYTLRRGRKANIIQVTNIEEKRKYTISRRDFDRLSFDYELSRSSVGEVQRACFLKYFAPNEPANRNYPQHIEAEPLKLKQAGQMSLFG